MQIMHLDWIAWGLLLGIALFAYWLNYCMGTPLADDETKANRGVDVGAIFFFVPHWMAKRRLKDHNLLAEFRHTLAEDLLAVPRDPVRRLELRKSAREDMYLAGRKFFTWERSILCPICLHYWLSVLIVGMILLTGYSHIFHGWGQLVLAYLVTHLIIRKLA